jgi:hypothetical protein
VPFLEEAGNILEGEEVHRATVVELPQQSRKLEWELVPVIVLTAMRGPAEALAGGATDDPGWIKTPLREPIQFRRLKRRYICDVARLCHSVVVVGADAGGAEIHGSRNTEAGLLKSKIEPTRTAEQAN